MLKLKRWQSGLWGVLSFSVMAVLVVSALVLLEMPPAVIWGGALFAGALLLLTTIGAVRGSQRRPQDFSAFDSNALSNPVNEEFEAPYHRALVVVPGETVLIQCAPIQQVTSSLGDLFKPGSWGLLGKGKTTNAENALVLTQKRLVFLMIGPDALKRYCSNPRVTRFLEAVPGDASAKRLALWRSGEAEVRAALSGLLAETSLEHLTHTLFSFTVPLSDISSIHHSLQQRTMTLEIEGQNLKHCFKREEDLAGLMRELSVLGLGSS